MTRSEVIRLIRGSQRRHYVYILGRPSGRPFYVGKGVAQRLFGHEIEARNPNILNYKVNINRSVWKTGLEIEYHIDEFFEHEPHALARERALIAQIGRHDLKAGPLANLLDGGEGASNPSEETKLRHADTLFGMDGVSERAIGNRFVRKLCPDLKSAPVKPLHAFKIEKLFLNRASMAFTPRQASALAASAIANRILLRPNAIIPRLLEIDGAKYCIENGVGRDILVSKMAQVVNGQSAQEDNFILSEAGCEYMFENIDRGLLMDAGVLVPE